MGKLVQIKDTITGTTYEDDFRVLVLDAIKDKPVGPSNFKVLEFEIPGEGITVPYFTQDEAGIYGLLKAGSEQPEFDRVKIEELELPIITDDQEVTSQAFVADIRLMPIESEEMLAKMIAVTGESDIELGDSLIMIGGEIISTQELPEGDVQGVLYVGEKSWSFLWHKRNSSSARGIIPDIEGHGYLYVGNKSSDQNPFSDGSNSVLTLILLDSPLTPSSEEHYYENDNVSLSVENNEIDFNYITDLVLKTQDNYIGGDQDLLDWVSQQGSKYAYLCKFNITETPYTGSHTLHIEVDHGSNIERGEANFICV